MISRLPPWVETGAFTLAFAAGSVNAVGLLGFSHQAVSHLTGTSTLLGLGMAQLDYSSSVHLLLVIFSFVAGAAFSGFLIDSSALQPGRRYGVALLLESALLLLAMFALQNNSVAGHYLASAACGLQNAMVTTYSGAIIRTTHVSGLFTDLGLMLGALAWSGPGSAQSQIVSAIDQRLYSGWQPWRAGLRCPAFSGVAVTCSIDCRNGGGLPPLPATQLISGAEQPRLHARVATKVRLIDADPFVDCYSASRVCWLIEW